MNEFLRNIKEFFSHQCSGCIANQYHILSLKEELHKKDELIMQLEIKLEEHTLQQSELINHLTGKSKVISREPGQIHSIPRNTGIQRRISRAEKDDREKAAPLNEQRRKEYEARVASLEKPEIEVLDNASEKS